MSRTERIAKAAKRYDSQSEVLSRRETAQDALKTLVDTYGLEDVAIAAGYTVSSLKVLIRSKMPPSISESTVKKAELILSNIE